MKRLILFFILFASLSVTHPVFAATPEAEQAANALHELKLFQGTGVNPDGSPNYDLDRVPTRNQAVIMLVRLLGKEEEARSGKWETPFTDVVSGSVSAPYIGYAYANGLTRGTTETTFSGTNPITRNQYLLFLMRVLGYSSNAWRYGGEEKMTTTEAAETAAELGLTDGTESGGFTRGEVALLSYRALDTYLCWMKPSLETLRESLGLGKSPKLADKPVSVEVTKYGSYEEADAQIKRKEDYFHLEEEISIPGGTLVHYTWGGLPHGTVTNLCIVCQDGTLIYLPLPELNGWRICAAPQKLSWNADSETVTYEAVLEKDLNWFGQPLRRAGTYRYTYDMKNRTAAVSETSPDSSKSVSTNPKDYGITDSMLSMDDKVNFPQLSLEALGAYYLHADGAGSEGAAYWLYQRFLAAPDTVLNYLVALGEQKARNDADRQTTAAREICRAIAFEDAYEPSEKFTETLKTCRAAHPDGPIAAVLKILEAEYSAAVERNQ